MNEVLSILGTLVLGLLVFLFAKKTRPKTGDIFVPENTAANVARENIQETFEEEVQRVERARVGDDPATALADLGNARRRK